MTLKFPQVLTLTFVIAKIMGGIDWAWALVFWPLYLAMGLELALRGLNYLLKNKP